MGTPKEELLQSLPPEKRSVAEKELRFVKDILGVFNQPHILDSMFGRELSDCIGYKNECKSVSYNGECSPSEIAVEVTRRELEHKFNVHGKTHFGVRKVFLTRKGKLVLVEYVFRYGTPAQTAPSEIKVDYIDDDLLAELVITYSGCHQLVRALDELCTRQRTECRRREESWSEAYYGIKHVWEDFVQHS